MSIFEYNEEAVRQALREEAREEGYEKGRDRGKIEGKIEDILYLLKEKGPVPAELEKQIKEQNDENILRKWLKLAGSVGSIEEFRMGI